MREGFLFFFACSAAYSDVAGGSCSCRTEKWEVLPGWNSQHFNFTSNDSHSHNFTLCSQFNINTALLYKLPLWGRSFSLNTTQHFTLSMCTLVKEHLDPSRFPTVVTLEIGLLATLWSSQSKHTGVLTLLLQNMTWLLNYCKYFD